MSAFKDQSGKINSSLFRELLKPYAGHSRDNVIQGPQFGVDTSIIQVRNGLGMAISSDPLSLIPSLGLKESAWLSVHLMANDMATTGFAPQYAQFVLNLSPEVSKEQFETYWQYIHEFCDEIGVAITGGHTGQVPGQASTIPGGGTMFLHAPLDQMLTSNRAEPGDQLVVTKECALTATSILAKSFPETVRERCGAEVHDQACANFYRTSSLPDALAAMQVLKPNTELKAMHDVTEGGILGAIAELAEASNCGFRVDDDRLPSSEVPKKIAEVFDIDHRYCVGAGSMIMAVKASHTKVLLDHLQSEGIPASAVGHLTNPEEGHVLIEDNKAQPFSFDGQDPYWGAFFKAMEAGWT